MKLLRRDMISSHKQLQKGYCQHSISTQLKMPQKGHHTAGVLFYYETPSSHNTENPVPRYLHYMSKRKGDFQPSTKEIGCPFKKGTNVQPTPCLQTVLLFYIYLLLTHPSTPISQKINVQNKDCSSLKTQNFSYKHIQYLDIRK